MRIILLTDSYHPPVDGMVFVVVGAVVGLIVSAVFVYSGFSDIPLDQSIQGVALGAIVSAAVMGVTAAVLLVAAGRDVRRWLRYVA